jgi:hypothetical protein
MERVAFLVEATGQRIDCMLNPETLEVRRLAGVRRHTTASGQLVGARLSDDPLLFTGGGRTELDLELMFSVDLLDARSAPSDVRDLTRPLWLLAENTAEERGGVRPPLVRLVWGKTWNVPVIVTSIAERFDDFDSAGVPRRSWLRVRLVRVPEPPPKIAVAPGSVELAPVAEGVEGGTLTDATVGPRPAAVRTVGDGAADEDFGGVRVDVLADVALGDARRWRELLAFNGIDDPLQVRPGTVLAVPPAEGGAR